MSLAKYNKRWILFVGIGIPALLLALIFNLPIAKPHPWSATRETLIQKFLDERAEKRLHDTTLQAYAHQIETAMNTLQLQADHASPDKKPAFALIVENLKTLAQETKNYSGEDLAAPINNAHQFIALAYNIIRDNAITSDQLQEWKNTFANRNNHEHQDIEDAAKKAFR